jgi:hypothetical protein
MKGILGFISFTFIVGGYEIYISIALIVLGIAVGTAVRKA